MEKSNAPRTLTFKYLTSKFKFDIEFLIWFSFYVILNHRFLIKYFSGKYTFSELLEVHDVSVFFGLFLIIFPVVFSQIFGEFPFRYVGVLIREERKRKIEYMDTVSRKDKTQDQAGEESQEPSSELEDEFEHEAFELLDSLVYKSANLSNKIYSRSGVYLLIGSMIALGGILYFSFRGITFTSKPEYLEALLVFLPRLGALFFIEFIAFFFLKQYRITMDDFKYYEAIARQRENNLLKLKLYLDPGKLNSEEVERIISSFDLIPNPTLINKDQTSEAIESRKFTNEEMAIFEKITTALTGKIGK